MSVSITTRGSVGHVSSNLITDYDGNAYTSVIIGTQEWLVENLKTTHYADGTLIPNLTLDADWIIEDGSSGHDGAMCYYNNDIANKPVYGALYNWYAVDSKFTDWFLPSKDELKAIHDELYLYAVGNFVDGMYWSSTESDSYGNKAWLHIFFQNVDPPIPMNIQAQAEKHILYACRPCRKFVSNEVYSLRDVGEAGGLIFYVIDNGDSTFTYYEAGIEDFVNYGYSNIEEFIGVTAQGSIIGTGQANTTAIINQEGHTDSAAKLCDDLSLGPKLVYFERNGVQEVGWRVPSETDFNTLITFAGEGTIAAKNLKEIGLTHWTTNEGIDSFGFKLLPGGSRYNSFNNIGDFGNLWTTDSYDINNYHYFYIAQDNSIAIGYWLKRLGYSVRCVRDI